MATLSSHLWYLLCLAVDVLTDITTFAHSTVVINLTDNLSLYKALHTTNLYSFKTNHIVYAFTLRQKDDKKSLFFSMSLPRVSKVKKGVVPASFPPKRF